MLRGSATPLVMLAAALSLLIAPAQSGDRVLAPFRAVPPRDVRDSVPIASPALQAQVRAMVDRDFARYDGDGDGRLDRLEFARWMATLSIAGQGTASRSWAETAFAEADTNASGGVDRAEVTHFVGRAAGWRLPAGPVRSGPARGG